MKPAIAYLAPEIPALSATFVTHEILALKKRGFQVLPISVHQPAAPALDQDAKRLETETVYLYKHGIVSFLSALATQTTLHPARTASAFRLWLADIFNTGLFTRNAAGLTYRFLAAAQLARILKNNNCRHLHAHFAHVPTDIAMYAARMAGIGFSFTSHANDLFERGWLLREKVERSLCAVTISRFNRLFLERLGAPADKISIIRCGVARHLPPADRPHGAIPRIGSLGRLVEKKGVDVLIRAAGNLARQGRDFTLEIAGSGPMQEALQACADSEGLSNKIRFCGPIPNDRVPAWLSGLDIFVLACKPDQNGDMDGIPVVLMEAMAADVPVISTTLSAIPELIQDGVSGLLAKPGDADDLSVQIARMLDDPQLQQRCISGGRALTDGEFSESLNIERIAELFNRLITDYLTTFSRRSY
jgi:glycosyltransferase involved in cell wall biosynthesis